jgi:hypothetical protein
MVQFEVGLEGKLNQEMDIVDHIAHHSIKSGATEKTK